MNAAQERLGRVELSPTGPVVAGTYGEWTLTYTVGSYGIDEGGTIKVARRFASDWQRPQFDDPTAEGYTTATTTGEAKLGLSFQPKGHIRPWMRCLVIDVYDGSLAPGDVVTITFGDRSQGLAGDPVAVLYRDAPRDAVSSRPDQRVPGAARCRHRPCFRSWPVSRGRWS